MPAAGRPKALALVGAALLAILIAGTGIARPAPAAIPTITVTMKDFAFRLSRASLPAGRVRFVFVDVGDTQHDWVVKGHRKLRSRLLSPGERQALVLTVPKGTLHFLCDVPGHAKLGMRGTLRVGAAAAKAPPPTTPAPPPVAGSLKLTTVATGLTRPDLVTAPPGDLHAIFVVEQNGLIERYVDGVPDPAPFLDLRPYVRLVSETGMLSMVFAPDFATSGRFYVDYNGREGNGDLHLVEYHVYATNPAVADPQSAREVLRIVKPWENHNGGMMQFGPDGHLYVSVGDGDSGVLHPPGAFAQTLDDLLGDILRIDPAPGPDGEPYTVPADNPFVSTPGARPEIWAYGLRNPWRFWIDPPTGTMVIGDVGEGLREELDVVKGTDLARGGMNFGWPCFEGTVASDPTATCADPVAPAYEYGHDGGRCSVIGGVVVHDASLPSLDGRYVFADLCDGKIMSAPLSGDGVLGAPEATGLTVDQPTSFGVDGAGHVYVTTLGGDVYRVDPAS